MDQAETKTMKCSKMPATTPPTLAGDPSRAFWSSNPADYIYQAATLAAALLVLMSV